MASKGIALVTGAAQGIGKAIARRLADGGFDVVLNDISGKSAALAQVVEEISAKGRTSSAHVADVAVEKDVREMVDKVALTYGRLDVMVANAGVANYNPILEMTADQWDHIMNINARGVFFCYKYAGIQMIKQGSGGRIIGACSLAGKQAGFPFNAAYTASKFAVRGLTQASAHEFGAYGITVNAYAPGAINTEMREHRAQRDLVYSVHVLEPVSAGMPTDTPRDTLINKPTDIANMVNFLASKESQFITGKPTALI
ncbi:hypothetical protein B0H19DRAFT_964656 [Mycena capillaripes]|nr:hypothetical protein B0H19DRAFT_964656 [Mycena capillaripes]